MVGRECARRRLDLRATIAVLILLLVQAPGNADAGTQSVSLVPGFNLVGFTEISSAVTSQTLMETTPGVVGIYRYDGVNRRYDAQLSLGAGDFDGTPFAFEAGRGYIVRATAATTLVVSGTAASSAVLSLPAGFSLISVLSAGLTSRSLMQSFPGLVGVYEYDPVARVYRSDLSLGAGDFDGAPLALEPGRGYVVRAASAVSGLSTKSAGIQTIAAGSILPGVTRLSSTGAAVLTVPALGPTEKVVVIPYAKSNVVAPNGYGYTLTSNVTPPAPTLLGSRAASPPAPPTDASPGTPRATAERQRRDLEQILAAIPASGLAARPARAPARALTLGSSLSFFARTNSNSPPTESDWTTVTATLRRVGTHCYLFEDNTESTNANRFTEANLDAMTAAFDNVIHPNVTAAFGAEPLPPKDIDGDDRVFILFSNTVNTRGAGGTFDAADERTPADLAKIATGVYKTNQHEMFYLTVPTAAAPANETNQNDRLSELAHEFYHMINFNQHVLVRGQAMGEDAWLNEGFAQVAEDVAGFGSQKGRFTPRIQAYFGNPGLRSVTNWTSSNADNGAAYLFARYLVDQGVSGATITQSALTGIPNVEAATGRPFADVFGDFAAALYVSNTTFAPGAAYQFKTLNLRGIQPDKKTLSGPTAFATGNVLINTTGTVAAWGMSYLVLDGGPGATVTLTLADPAGQVLGATVIRGSR